ncbi:MAG: ABC transporter ATP-binding protein, partial [Rhabdochlamydiaceae bacterium]
GAIQSVLTSDVLVYQNAINLISDSISGPIKAISALGYILFIQPYLALIAIAILPPMAIVIQRNGQKMNRAQRTVQDDLANVSASNNEILQGIRVIKSFAAESQANEQYSELIESSYRSQMQGLTTFSNLRPLVEFIGAFALAILLALSGILASQGKLNVADVMALVLAMDTINQGFKSFAGISNTNASVQAASDRIYAQILDIPEEESETGLATAEAVREQSQTKPKFTGRVEFDDVSFVYPDGTIALENVSFVIEPGQALALVGPSGAGKSTIADLILRFYTPTSGRILIDGYDVTCLKRSDLRNLIGVVPQQTFLFAGTIEDNVRLGKADATDIEIQQAIQLAHAEGFTKEMLLREASELGERGAKLSGGQMQRVAIARAIVRDPLILVLDEATSALDAESEKIVTQALQEVMKARTTILIAHRLTTAARSDRILFLNRGKIVESGSHEELMKAGGEYAALFKLFSGGLLLEGIQ